MKFQFQDVWMSMLAYTTLLSPDEIVEALNENGFPCQMINLQWAESASPNDPNPLWNSFRMIGPEQDASSERALIDVGLFPANVPEVARCLNLLKQRVAEQPVCEERSNVLAMLEEAKYVAQSIKVGGNLEAASELEFGLHCCLGFPPEPDEGVSLWTISHAQSLGFATESELLLKFEDQEYSRLAGV